MNCDFTAVTNDNFHIFSQKRELRIHLTSTHNLRSGRSNKFPQSLS